ncbi:MAG TPA: ABC transporter permease [Terracidiphilus sp.]|jgi:lipopolysaccharide transport system permease protein|nr:ABC transporter permease [Terracidiphilus sp.]
MRRQIKTTYVAVHDADGSWRWRFRALWLHRELLYFLALRDIKVRYKQTVLGAVWVVLQPAAIALTLTLFLGRLVQVPSAGMPYLVFAYSGMVVWLLFANSLTESSNSLTANDRLIGKVYFPRLVIPISVVLAALPDFAINACVLGLMLAYYHLVPAWTLLLAPLLVVLELMAALGTGLWLTALNVKYRDVRYTVNFLVQFWFFATPIAYPVSVVPQRWQAWYGLNPMVGVVEGFRWSLTGEGPIPARLLAISAGMATVLLLSGLAYFSHTEDTFADFI